MRKIVICGAGPTGLTLGCLLRQKGFNVTIIEKEMQSSSHTKALMIHANSLEVFEQIAVINQILNKGIKQKYIKFYMLNDCEYKIDFTKLDMTKYPFYVNLSQPVLEEILEVKFASLAGKILRGCELINLNQSVENVTIDCLINGVHTELICDYLIACDGASSTVRKLLNIEYEGTTYPFSYVLAEGVPSANLPKDESSMYITQDVVLSVLPIENGQYRVAGPGNMKLLNNTFGILEFENMLEKNKLNFLKFDSYSSLRNYQVNERVAKNLVDGRVILCGDAGHIHSPTGGQAMNLGIGDAFSLYWRFNPLLNTSTELSGYEIERLKIAKKVVQSAHLFNKLDIMRNGTEIEKSELTLLMKHYAKIFSQLNHYPSSNFTSGDAELIVGARIPDLPLDNKESLWSKIIQQDTLNVDPFGEPWQKKLASYFNINKNIKIKIRPDMIISEVL